MNNITTRPTTAATTDPATGTGFDRLFDELFDGFFTRPTGSWMPPADVTEAIDHIDLRIDLPGLKRSDIEITVEDGQLAISGNREETTLDDGAGRLRRERRFGSFSRRFTLGERFDTDAIQAEYRDGVLSLRVPKRAAAVAKRIDIA
jgi:HSP20 family protein